MSNENHELPYYNHGFSSFNNRLSDTACTDWSAFPDCARNDISNHHQRPTCSSNLSQPLTLAQSATNVVNALQKHDLTAIAELVHPQWGLRFSPYAFVHETDLFFSKVQIPGLLEDITIYQWGTYDGSGEPISLDFPEYFDEFVYNVDFANPEMIGYNKEIGTGNVPNNISDFFPGAEFVEYHFSGFDPQYGGMDWQSLRLVFIKEKGQYFLVGIVHAQWTI